jgi:hypothetical protein
MAGLVREMLRSAPPIAQPEAVVPVPPVKLPGTADDPPPEAI